MRRFATWLSIAALTTGIAAPQDEIATEKVAQAIGHGLEFLISDQNENGSWGGTKNIVFSSYFANPATYKMWQIGSTALATRTLLELGREELHGMAADRGLDFLMANDKPARPADWDVDNNWAIIYSLDTVSRAIRHPRYVGTPQEELLRKSGQNLSDGLKKYQGARGGWGYYSMSSSAYRPDWATSFTTAVAVLSMIEARESGLNVDPKVFETGVRAVEMSRLPNGAYNYDVSAVPRHMTLESINQVKGSVGRIQVCNLALYRAGSELVTKEDLIWGLEQFVKHHKFLDVARNRPIPHEAYYANAAYFYLFAHYYASQVLEELSATERKKFAPHIQDGILKVQQKDGSMWDFWIASNARPYGTSFGVLGLEFTIRPLD